MQATFTASTDWKQRFAPVACGGALAGAAAVVALYDPSAAGSRFPVCQFHAATGLWCPGCGLTRGFHQLLTGHPLSAMSYNLFVPLVLVLVVGSWWGWLRTSWGRPALVWPAWTHQAATRRWVSIGVPVVLVAYGVLRNIPAPPFRSLAP